MRPPLPRRARTAGAAVVAALVVLLAAPAGAAPVAPEPPAPVDLGVPGLDPTAGSDVLRQQVATLAAQVDHLDVQAEVAAEDWNEVRSELDALVAQEVQAQVSLDEAGRVLRSDRASATRRVRALYRAGGTTEIAWAALAASSVGGPAASPAAGLLEAADGLQAARVVLGSDAAAVGRARDRVDAAVTSSVQVQALRRERAGLEAEAEQRRLATEAALRARQDLLAASDAVLVQAVERERQEAERAALAAAVAAAEAQARARALAVASPVGTTGSGRYAGLSPAARAQALAQDSAGTVGPGGGTVRAGTVGADVQAVLDRAAAAAPTATAAAAIRAAGTRLGLPYTWGATGPGTFDCSGLTMWAYAQAGTQLPRTSRQQYAGLPKVPVSELLPGDLVFYAHGSDPGSIHHVSIWLGDGLILTAPRTGDVVKVSAVWRQPLYGAVRPTS